MNAYDDIGVEIAPYHFFVIEIPAGTVRVTGKPRRMAARPALCHRDCLLPSYPLLGEGATRRAAAAKEYFPAC